jgi:hypothetical protein
MASDARWGGVMGMPRPVGPADDWVDLGLLQIDQATNKSWRSSGRAHYRLTPGGVLTMQQKAGEEGVVVLHGLPESPIPSCFTTEATRIRLDSGEWLSLKVLGQPGTSLLTAIVSTVYTPGHTRSPPAAWMRKLGLFIHPTDIALFKSTDGATYDFVSFVATANSVPHRQEGPNEHGLALLPNIIPHHETFRTTIQPPYSSTIKVELYTEQREASHRGGLSVERRRRVRPLLLPIHVDELGRPR